MSSSSSSSSSSSFWSSRILQNTAGEWAPMILPLSATPTAAARTSARTLTPRSKTKAKTSSTGTGTGTGKATTYTSMDIENNNNNDSAAAAANAFHKNTTTETGYARMKKPMFFWYLFLTMGNKILYFAFSKSGNYMQPVHDLCETSYHYSDDGTCHRGDIVAFMVMCSIPMAYIAYKGFVTWYGALYGCSCQRTAAAGNAAGTTTTLSFIINKDFYKNKSPTMRFFETKRAAEQILGVQFMFSIWFVLSVIPFIRKMESTADWILVLGYPLYLAWMCGWSLYKDYLHHYGVYYFGVANAFHLCLLLTFFDSFFLDPKTDESYFSDITNYFLAIVCTGLLLSRVYVWTKVTWQLLKDFRVLKRNNQLYPNSQAHDKKQQQQQQKAAVGLGMRLFVWSYVLIHCLVASLQLSIVVAAGIDVIIGDDTK